MSDALNNWEDGKPVVYAGFEASGELGIWEDGAPVVREDTAGGGPIIGSSIIPVRRGSPSI